MNKQWIVLIVVLSLVIGFGAGKLSTPAAQIGACDSSTLQQKFDQMTAKDFEEYQNLKTLEEKYKKADELLGKILLVFLADVGVRTNFKSTAGEALGNTQCTVPAVVANPSATASPISSAVGSNEKPSSSKSSGWLNLEKQLPELSRPEDLLAEMKKAPVEDLFSVLKTSSGLNKAEGSALEGVFQGEVNFYDHAKQKVDWYIAWEIHIASETDFKGYSQVTLTKKNSSKPFSRSTSGGRGRESNLPDFSRPAGSKAVVINVNNDDGYIQVYPIGKDQWVGNYYEKIQLGEYKNTGQVSLHRVQ